jgi:rhamnogalacturonyl hydrolase YesR
MTYFKKIVILVFLFPILLHSTIVSAQEIDMFGPKYIKEILLKVSNWQLTHSNNKQENDWTNGAFYTGLFATYQTTKSPIVLDSLLAMGERKRWLPGKRFDNADDYAISQTYIDLYRIKKELRMIQPTLDSLQKMKTQPGKAFENHGLTWWWCDALYMAPPVLVKLAKTLKDPSYLVLNDTLYHQTYQLLYNKEEHLFARDARYLWNEKGEGQREANGKRLFWTRGNGWVLGGLVRVLQEMPKDYANRNFYVQLYTEMCQRILLLQQSDGLWRTSMLDPDAYPGGEGSGTGFNCYALAWGVNNKLLDRKLFLPAVKKAWIGLNTLLTPEGKLGWVQPIGGTSKRNFNAESWEAYGSGAFLLAGSELFKLKK